MKAEWGASARLEARGRFRRVLKTAYVLLCAALLSGLAHAGEPDANQAVGDNMAIWIDVRTPEEFALGHVNGAINIPYEIIGSEISAVTRDVDSDIRVYCRSGKRSGVAKDTLSGMGYSNVINEGGYEDLMQRKASGDDIP